MKTQRDRKVVGRFQLSAKKWQHGLSIRHLSMIEGVVFDLEASNLPLKGIFD